MVDDETQQVRARLSDLLIEIRYKIFEGDLSTLKHFDTVLKTLINDKSKFVSEVIFNDIVRNPNRKQ
jgi:hypothetical protein